MAKKARQAHIPSQIKKRKARRPGTMVIEPLEVDAMDVEAVEADDEAVIVAPVARRAAQPRPGRRLELVTRTRDSVSLRAIPGQLPTFERSYLVRELRQITLTAGVLLAVIIALSLVLR